MELARALAGAGRPWSWMFFKYMVVNPFSFLLRYIQFDLPWEELVN
jgi:hypothetical protein